jgi:hypothetical protein
MYFLTLIYYNLIALNIHLIFFQLVTWKLYETYPRNLRFEAIFLLKIIAHLIEKRTW